MTTFAVRVEVQGDDRATPQALVNAIQYLMAEANRRPPDRRFRWDHVKIEREG